jgi:hypothetical protein
VFAITVISGNSCGPSFGMHLVLSQSLPQQTALTEDHAGPTVLVGLSNSHDLAILIEIAIEGNSQPVSTRVLFSGSNIFNRSVTGTCSMRSHASEA